MKILFWVALASGPLAVLLLLAGAWLPALVEHLYSRGLYSAMSPAVSRLVGLSPFPVAPFLLVLGLGAAVGAFFVHPKAWMGVLAGLSVLVAWFILGWGLNYQRQSWAQNVGWSVKGGRVADLQELAAKLALRTDSLRQQAWKNGSPPWRELLKDVPHAYERASVRWPLLAGRYPGPKSAPLGEAFSWMGISGIFMPFTGEPLVNMGPGGWSLPFTAAHESAHLHGWAREDEANFLAFLVLHDCGDPRLEYSAWSMALLYVVGALQEQGSEGLEAWASVSKDLSPDVKEDWKTYFAYWDRFKGPVQKAALAVNDTYLKAQGQADGVKSYGRMVDLLLAWENAP